MAKERSDARYVVLSSGITGSSGELRRKGEVLTAEQVGTVARFLARGSIREATPDEAGSSQVTIVEEVVPGSTSVDQQVADRDRQLETLRQELREAHRRIGTLEQQIKLKEGAANTGQGRPGATGARETKATGVVEGTYARVVVDSTGHVAAGGDGTPELDVVLGHTLPDVITFVAKATDVEKLKSLRAREEADKNRAGALKAIDARLEELGKGQG